MEGEEEEVIIWDGGDGGGPQLGAGLMSEEHELRELLRQHKDALTRLSGCTHLTEHTIEQGTAIRSVSSHTGCHTPTEKL